MFFISKDIDVLIPIHYRGFIIKTNDFRNIIDDIHNEMKYIYYNFNSNIINTIITNYNNFSVEQKIKDYYMLPEKYNITNHLIYVYLHDKINNKNIKDLLIFFVDFYDFLKNYAFWNNIIIKFCINLCKNRNIFEALLVIMLYKPYIVTKKYYPIITISKEYIKDNINKNNKKFYKIYKQNNKIIKQIYFLNN